MKNVKLTVNDIVPGHPNSILPDIPHTSKQTLNEKKSFTIYEDPNRIHFADLTISGYIWSQNV